jgi:hypothetical protein
MDLYLPQLLNASRGLIATGKEAIACDRYTKT